MQDDNTEIFKTMKNMQPKKRGKMVKIMSVLKPSEGSEGLEFVEDLSDYAYEEEGETIKPSPKLEDCHWPIAENEHNAYSMLPVEFVGSVEEAEAMDVVEDVLGLGPIGAITLVY